MEKRIGFCLLLMLFVAFPSFAENVPVTAAQRVGQTFMNAKLEKNSELTLIDISENTNLSNIYVFGNESSFVIVSGEDCVIPILGYSTEGGFDTNQIPECVIDWLRSYDEAIESAKERRLEPTSEIRTEWEKLLNGQRLEPKSRSIVAPLVRTKWGQMTPYNNLCPIKLSDSTAHVPAGCGAIAMAQIMNYWEHPVRGEGSHLYEHEEYGIQYADFGATTYDWDNMKNVYYKGYNNAEAEAVATLVYHCGVSVEMDYDPNGSNVRRPIMDDALRDYFDFNPMLEYYHKSEGFTNEQWIARLKGDLDNGQPVLYRGRNPQHHNVAHIFICDGYDENSLFHFNWGLEGAYDGFFVIGALYPGPDDYSDDNYAIFDCFPNQTSINPPASINALVVDRNVTISWSLVGDASSYKVYRDENMIACGIQGTSFNDSNVTYGYHSYYVKSVKSDGTMSLRSNVVSVDVHYSGPLPEGLEASVNNQSVHVSWQIPVSEYSILQYGSGAFHNSFGLPNSGLFWGQRYTREALSDYIGMAVEKVSVYFNSSGTYTLIINSGDETNTTDEIFSLDYEAVSIGWQDIVLPNPVCIDFSKDLWIVVHADIGISSPASYCSYSGENVFEAGYWSSAGFIWKHNPNILSGNYSWMMKTFITDGTYSYNLYRNGNTIANNLSGNSYTDSNLPDGLYNYYVTTNYFGGESDPSNTVQVQVGNPMYTITTNVSPANGGTVTGGGTYPAGSTVTLTANANPSYTFSQWNDGSTDNPRTITVNANATYTATFTQDQYSVTTYVNPAGAGTVTGGGTYHYGDTPTLIATANTGYEFQGWSDGDTQNPRTITVTGNASYTAIFSEVGITMYAVTTSVNPSGAGTVTGAGTYEAGTVIVLTANANAGYTFDHWNDGSTQNPRVVTVNSNLNFTAYFTQNQYVIIVVASPSNAGTVSGGGAYYYGNYATLTATAYPDYEFQGWSDGSSENPHQVLVTDNATYTATFSAAGSTYYTVSAYVSPTGAGTVSGTGSFPAGSTTTLIATTNSGYVFDHWNDGVTTPTRTVTVNNNMSFTAYFNAKQYTITVNANPAAGGTVSGGGTYPYGATATLTATSNSGYSFMQWSDGNTSNPRTVTVTGNATYTALFMTAGGETFMLTVTSGNQLLGQVAGGGIYPAGVSVEIRAIPSSYARFVKWNDDNTDNPRTVVVNDNLEFVAEFVAIPLYTITVNSSNSDWGYVLGGGTFKEGTEIQISAFANTGYMFTGWNDGNNQNPRTITVTGNATYTAQFVENTTTTYTLNLICNTSEGTVSGGGVYTAGTAVIIQAFPNSGYVFNKWSDEVVDNPRILMVNSDMTLEAFFATGIDENAMVNVKVYPNPAKESICLIGIETNSEIQIYNMFGELVKTVNAGPNERIGINGLANGVYIVRVGRISKRVCIIN